MYFWLINRPQASNDVVKGRIFYGNNAGWMYFEYGGNVICMNHNDYNPRNYKLVGIGMSEQLINDKKQDVCITMPSTLNSEKVGFKSKDDILRDKKGVLWGVLKNNSTRIVLKNVNISSDCKMDPIRLKCNFDYEDAIIADKNDQLFYVTSGEDFEGVRIAFDTQDTPENEIKFDEYMTQTKPEWSHSPHYNDDFNHWVTVNEKIKDEYPKRGTYAIEYESLQLFTFSKKAIGTDTLYKYPMIHEIVRTVQALPHQSFRVIAFPSGNAQRTLFQIRRKLLGKPLLPCQTHEFAELTDGSECEFFKNGNCDGGCQLYQQNVAEWMYCSKCNDYLCCNECAAQCKYVLVFLVFLVFLAFLAFIII